MPDSRNSQPIDMHRALLDPESLFGSPEALLRNEALSKKQKVELLRRWEYDASEACVALEEGMPGDESDLLRRILLALNKLIGDTYVERVSSSKHHGIPR